MAKAKKSKKKDEANAIREWTSWAGEWCRYGVSVVFAEHTWRVIGLAAIVGVTTAWAVARGPLQQTVAKNAIGPLSVLSDGRRFATQEE